MEVHIVLDVINNLVEVGSGRLEAAPSLHRMHLGTNHL